MRARRAAATVRARRAACAGVGAALAVLLAACGDSDPGAVAAPPVADASEASPSPSTPAAPQQPVTPAATPTASADPRITRIDDAQWARIVGTGTWRPGCPVGRAELRRLDIGYWTFDGRAERGALVAHADSIDDLAAVMTALFEARFPIARMIPVEEYAGDTAASLAANNTSAFNCRRPDQINAPVLKSPHANGRAIDINPVQNPWKDLRCRCWQPSAEFAKVTTGPGVIRKGSLPYRLFTQRGWIWQNIDVPDYMHFDTGYPSRPR